MVNIAAGEGRERRPMKILNFGSINMDYVYSVEHIVQPGETIRARERDVFCGGKGLNQSIALAFAGANIYHAGIVGEDGDRLLQALRSAGVQTQLIRRVQGESSHTVIQVDENGQNCIIFFAGDNISTTEEYIDEVLQNFQAGDLIILQNELERTDSIIQKAKQRGLKVALNPSPMNDLVATYPLDCVDIFLLNEVEGEALSGETIPEAMLQTLHQKYPKALLVLTLGKQGCLCQAGEKRYQQPIVDAPVVDTTAAGDTFSGYFLTAYTQGESIEYALELATRASAIAVSRKGASDSIPKRAEIAF